VYSCIGDDDNYWPKLGTKLKIDYCDYSGLGLGPGGYENSQIILITTHQNIDFVQEYILFDKLVDGQGVSYVDDNGKRIVIVVSMDENILNDILSNIPDDITFTDYNYIFEPTK
jgi:hypothetical protein